MSFTDAEENDFRAIADNLPPLQTDLEYELRLIFLLAEDRIDCFEQWQTKRRESWFNSLFNHRGALSIAKLADAIKNIDFDFDSTFEEFEELTLSICNAPRIPLFTTRSNSYIVQLGGSVGSSGLLERDAPHAKVPLSDRVWHKNVQEFNWDPTLTPPPKERKLAKGYGFSIGTILVEGRYHKSDKIEDTCFILVLSAREMALYMVYNYYPVNDQGDPLQFKPLEHHKLEWGSREQLRFDCTKLYDSVLEWDPEMPKSVLFEFRPYLARHPATCHFNGEQSHIRPRRNFS